MNKYTLDYLNNLETHTILFAETEEEKTFLVNNTNLSNGNKCIAYEEDLFYISTWCEFGWWTKIGESDIIDYWLNREHILHYFTGYQLLNQYQFSNQLSPSYFRIGNALTDLAKKRLEPYLVDIGVASATDYGNESKQLEDKVGKRLYVTHKRVLTKDNYLYYRLADAIALTPLSLLDCDPMDAVRNVLKVNKLDLAMLKKIVAESGEYGVLYDELALK